MRCYNSFLVEIIVESVNLITDVKIENYYHYDEELLGFYQKKYISKHRAKCFILQETKDSNLLDNNCTQKNVKCHTQHEDS